MTQAKKVNKDWGDELWLANNKEFDYCGKILTIKPGKSTSMHFHSNKHETFYILEGELEVTIVDTETTEQGTYFLEPGRVFEVCQNVPHRLSANGIETKFIEISTFHEDSDSYRVCR